jgi:hypothetical protein
LDLKEELTVDELLDLKEPHKEETHLYRRVLAIRIRRARQRQERVDGGGGVRKDIRPARPQYAADGSRYGIVQRPGAGVV